MTKKPPTTEGVVIGGSRLAEGLAMRLSHLFKHTYDALRRFTNCFNSSEPLSYIAANLTGGVVIMFPRSPSFPFCEVNYLAHSNPAFVSFISQNENGTELNACLKNSFANLQNRGLRK
jgi:hypothetical protein